MDISFLTVDAFAPDADPWVPVGPISSVSEESSDFHLRLRDEALTIRLSFRLFREVRGSWRRRVEL